MTEKSGNFFVQHFEKMVLAVIAVLCVIKQDGQRYQPLLREVLFELIGHRRIAVGDDHGFVESVVEDGLCDAVEVGAEGCVDTALEQRFERYSFTLSPLHRFVVL